jgi:hypothetical protein
MLQQAWGLWKMYTKMLKLQLADAVLSRIGEGGDCRKKNNRTWLRCGRNMSDGKSLSFAFKKGLRGLEKM